MIKAMAARTTVDDFSDRLDSLRSMMHTLMKEAVESFHPLKIDSTKGIDYYEAVEKYETELIKTALDMTGGHQKDAARLLNIANSTLCMKMKRFKIPSNPNRP